jgi:hypothetical protein
MSQATEEELRLYRLRSDYDRLVRYADDLRRQLMESREALAKRAPIESVRHSIARDLEFLLASGVGEEITLRLLVELVDSLYNRIARLEAENDALRAKRS